MKDASFASPVVFNAIVGGFAAFGSIAGFWASFAGFVAWFRRYPMSSIADASAWGLATSFPWAIAFAGLYVYDQLAPHVLSLSLRHL